MVTLTEYIAYFENIAKNHKAIKHSNTQKHFFKIDLEELISGLKTAIVYPALVLEGYDFSFIDNVSDNILKQRTCAFSILLKPKNTGDFKEIYSLYDIAEGIVNDIINLMWDHKRQRGHTIVADFDLNSIEVLPISGIVENAVGYRVSFNMETGHDPEVTENNWITTDF